MKYEEENAESAEDRMTFAEINKRLRKSEAEWQKIGTWRAIQDLDAEKKKTQELKKQKNIREPLRGIFAKPKGMGITKFSAPRSPSGDERKKHERKSLRQQEKQVEILKAISAREHGMPMLPSWG